MYKALSPGAIGVTLPLEQCAVVAAANGFEGIYLDIRDVAGSVEATRELLADRNLRPAGFGLPVEFRRDEESFRHDMAELPALARAAAQLGCFRCSTWVPSWHDELAFPANYALCKRRFTEVAAILNDHNIRLGLEFLGPATLRRDHRFEFIHTMQAMLELCRDVGTGNVGLLLDCWHWYTSRGTLAQLRALSNDDVVDVHVNDAPAGLPIDQQVDNLRAIPGSTGVIDLTGFLGALATIGYDGPVTAEPFCRELNQMDDAEAIETIAASLQNVFQRASLTG